MVNTLFLDLETYCETPLSHGTHVYAADAEVIIAAYAFDDGPVHTLDLTHFPNGEARINRIEHYTGMAETLVFHNSAFDRTVLRHNGLYIPASQIHDTMVQALAHSLPGGLEPLCEIMRVPLDKAKSKEGKRLINLFCKPRPKKQKLRRATRETHPAEWAEFLDYARLDIEAMREIHKCLPKWNNTEGERKLWLLDQKINDRGMQIDMELVHAALAAVDLAQAGLADDTMRLTNDTVEKATQRDAIIRFLWEAYEIKMPNLTMSTIEAMLENDNYPPEVLELLRVRLQASTSSTAKYKRLLQATSADGRLRGTKQFCGAMRTGRWAGRIFQPDNLPRPTLDQEEIDVGIDAIKAGAAHLLTDNVMRLSSSAIRGTIIPAPKRKLVVADLSNIEGRALAWLAGEKWKLEAFAAFDRGEGEDLYKVTAGGILNKPPEDVTKDERQSYGKVTELSMGYEGGVGAFATFAITYEVDLEKLADSAWENLKPHLVDQAREFLEWTKEKKRSRFGLDDKVFVACDAIKRGWREKHPATVRLWKNFKEATQHVVEGTIAEATVGKCRILRTKNWLRIILPSGRNLCYPSARFDGKNVSYMGINQYSRQWNRLKTYGGKLVENVTQAVARDVLAYGGMLPADEAGYDLIMSIHDELLTDVPETNLFTVEGLSAIMSTQPIWAAGLPLAAAGFEGKRYKK
ncbi:MAG: hypothetical protein ABL936_00340 [Aestuariivirga sp.]